MTIKLSIGIIAFNQIYITVILLFKNFKLIFQYHVYMLIDLITIN